MSIMINMENQEKNYYGTRVHIQISVVAPVMPFVAVLVSQARVRRLVLRVHSVMLTAYLDGKKVQFAFAYPKTRSFLGSNSEVYKHQQQVSIMFIMFCFS